MQRVGDGVVEKTETVTVRIDLNQLNQEIEMVEKDLAFTQARLDALNTKKTEVETALNAYKKERLNGGN